ncbi:MAG: hypothetical protein A2626_02825 [Candidatus Nealsonbacteria bacterium RIFCSPHIGHO2_01_FULL_38_55]|uniref:Uncharacterized protein n=1 Tax=Candidatus Nealsonbacteria bacterium RIFCSPHIGHO2_01_FULL_38_55 TaxID=1801664 RepID=A0A1G2E1D7_9BACT|nr:MAG: hypothetical protein US88_C0002G0037 [Parcubacteria group bacterium GW2011_GWA2_38_27]OGZ19643.1 MAG: hypothetical protein A2626_02825 [Candidatus Nealsonbacteria bacterium RIFCSPHIGHO2_01_FULL_38_55]OGZ21913.1 MAG: hypothetical protein A3C48_00125 [Candidatus Nealsonbacteria bacterium RIFCSPHIGHO2_02_FULL_38_75]OGZ22729.1 MAG: hypothetical protein A2981_01470 [Candidatus Nealsonbacteria bacterium RIFCSPLOWO2_01_FULL_38_120]OGZ26282.1 MAG: hypothetical protein A3I85_01310 [Candidatus Ne
MTEFDENLNKKDSLLNTLNRSLDNSTPANEISGGVFGSNSSDNGIAFGINPATNKSYIQSRNFVSGSDGWQLLSDGNFEGNNGTKGSTYYPESPATDGQNGSDGEVIQLQI